MDLLCFSVLRSLCLCVRLFICALWSPAGKGLASWLSSVASYYEFFTFPLVSWVRCGTCLYQFRIFAPLLTLLRFLAALCYYFIVIRCIFIQLLSNSQSSEHRLYGKRAAYSVHHMLFVYQHQSCCDSLPCGFMYRV